jgi:hypothetical protein
MNWLSLWFENPFLMFFNVIMLIGIVLAIFSIQHLNRITKKQKKRNAAMHKANTHAE